LLNFNADNPVRIRTEEMDGIRLLFNA
jgi:hypothetical protein